MNIHSSTHTSKHTLIPYWGYGVRCHLSFRFSRLQWHSVFNTITEIMWQHFGIESNIHLARLSCTLLFCSFFWLNIILSCQLPSFLVSMLRYKRTHAIKSHWWLDFFSLVATHVYFFLIFNDIWVKKKMEGRIKYESASCHIFGFFIWNLPTKVPIEKDLDRTQWVLLLRF